MFRSVLCLVGILLPAGIPAAAIVPATTTTLAVTSGGNPVATVTLGSVVTLTATVATGATAVRVGQVNFCDATAAYCTDIHLLGTAQLTVFGTATLKLRPGAGNHSYKAVFAGTTEAKTSSSGAAALSVSGGKSPTVTSIAKSGSAGSYSLTATVGWVGSSAATGTVSFLDTGDGNAVLGEAALGAATPGLSFFDAEDLALGSSESALIAADFNGDGIPDIAVSSNPSGITILKGNGDGSLTPLPSIAQFGSVALGDFNGDGKPDLAVYGDGLLILLGNGDGTFRPQPPMELACTGGIAVGDFNGDGVEDLAVTCGGSIDVLLGVGDGTFTELTTSAAAGTDSTSIAVGDFNGDGIPDLIVGGGDPVLSLLLGNGDGTFANAILVDPAPPTAGCLNLSTNSIVVGDFNGDGNPDVAVSVNCQHPNSYGGSWLTVLLGDGTGNFPTGTAINIVETAELPSPNSLAVGDFNGDGIADLAVTDKNGSGGMVLLGKGDGTFTAAGSPGIVPPVVASDLNGDGITDLAGPNSSGSFAVFLIANETATSAAAPISLPVATGTHLVVARYPGDSNHVASTSLNTGLTAPLGTPTVSLATSATSAKYGTPVTFTSNVAGTGRAPTGAVQFMGGLTVLCSGTISDGVASCTTSTIVPGAYHVTANYSGDNDYTSAASAPVSVSISPAPTVTPKMAVVLSAPIITTGQALTVSITVSGGSALATPTGSVTLTSGSYTAPTATLSGGNVTISIPAGSLSVGSDTLTMAYTPDAASALIYGSVKQTAPITVTLPIGSANSTMTATPSAATITDQQTDVVAVSVAGGSGQPTPTGTIVVASGTFSTSKTLSGGTAQLTIPAGALSSGTNALTVTYSGDATYGVESTVTTVTVSEIVIAVSTPAAVSAGGTASGSLTLAVGSTYSGTVALTCGLSTGPIGAQSPPTCSLSPASVAIAKGANGSSALKVTTTAASSTALMRPSRHGLWGLGEGGALLAGLLIFLVPSRRRRWISMLILLPAVLAGAAIGCNGGGTVQTTGPGTPATTAGSYVFTLTGTDSTNASITSSTSVTITVQ